jgi:hypothetical protein
MAKISASEVKRVVYAMKDRGASLSEANRYELSQVLATRPNVEKRMRPLLKKSGIELDTTEGVAADNRAELRPLLEKRSARALKAFAGIEDPFRRGVDDHIKAVEYLNKIKTWVFNGVVLESPFLIWAEPASVLRDSKIEPRNSTANVRLREEHFEDDEILINVDFYFMWENTTYNPALVNIGSYLILRGWCQSWSDSGFPDLFFGPHGSLQVYTNLHLLEWWNQPPTEPLFQQRQAATALKIETDGGSSLFGSPGETKSEYLFNGYELEYYLFQVPLNKVVLFQVRTQLFYIQAGSGGFTFDFLNDGGYIKCPYLKIEVMAPA